MFVSLCNEEIMSGMNTHFFDGVRPILSPVKTCNT
jgi:hypothetical protein